ncbi:MAG: Si-specific NAD(P)(+) transhydrogenase [Gemmataceae bacterium]
MPDEFDLVVIGGGPAGTSGAIVSGLLGKSVALIEKANAIGGAGINTGTIPSKTLRESALALSGWRSRQLFGVDLSLRREATIAEFMHHQNQVTADERRRVKGRLHSTKAETLIGTAKFVDPHTIRVEHAERGAREIRGKHILIASGSSPLHPPEFAFEDDRVHDSNEILELKAIPKRLAVVGGGVIGCEYACTFAALGSQVDLIDGRGSLLPFLDGEISRILADTMRSNGVRIHFNEKVVKCDSSAPGDVTLTLGSGLALACDGVLVCAGRVKNTDDLNLPAAGVATGERGLICVDKHYRTNVPHIYAAGDVIGAPALAATGMEQARIAVSHALDFNMKSDLAPLLPSGIYTIPEASMVGETEESLNAKGVPYVVGRAPYDHNVRGKIIGDRTGLLKLLFHAKDMKLLGVHVVGELATEVVHIGLMAMLAEGTVDMLTRACFNYPTLGDLYKYAAYDAILKHNS